MYLSYLTENTARLQSKDRSVNDILGNTSCILPEAQVRGKKVKCVGKMLIFVC